MIILGIDPGYINTGYGIINIINNKINFITEGVINTKNKNKYFIINNIYNKLLFIILKFKPINMAIEHIFVGKNFDSIIKLSYAKAASLLVAENNNIKIFEYNYNKVKK
ncbi:crossover junction endodeoxyribonuclease RuvC [Candidatus Nardonella dryophthoridicola]|uniref:Crossover junction endodeoxyribonuclease RuvC n=1 Tax=endosymbiont of Metamasius hemipterus TaxID=204627 RepID=A0ABT0TW38_9GAMM|nr:crossover junction endodeoxyribonuclease RuvC [Candidatus Nardonella dryophthoridicola]MCM0158222.1 crossover junction endodeoxyribonuclease RuvC [endosymbiont of Metamasius hemipterus]